MGCCNQELKKVFADQGIPDWARPQLEFRSCDSGKRAFAARRRDLTYEAQSQLETVAAATRAELDRLEAEAHARLISPSLTSEIGEEVLAGIPSIEHLMPRISVADTEALAEAEVRVRNPGPIVRRRLRDH